MQFIVYEAETGMYPRCWIGHNRLNSWFLKLSDLTTIDCYSIEWLKHIVYIRLNSKRRMHNFGVLIILRINNIKEWPTPFKIAMEFIVDQAENI